MKTKTLCLLLTSLAILSSCKDKSTKNNGPEDYKVVLNLNDREVRADSIDSFIRQQMDLMKIPGLSFAIINNGRIAYHNVIGHTDNNSLKPVTDLTLFEGASTSKALFAYMTMFLVEEGKLDLDTPLAAYLDPAHHANYNFDERYDQVTARMVLSHTTGFPNWRGDGNLYIGFEPGTDFSYSGEGYQYLVKALESILDTDYKGLEEFYQKKVAVPLGMKYTKFVQDEYNLAHKAAPHKEGIKLPLNHWTAREFNAASAIHTDAIDFSKWVIALLENKGLSEESYDLLFTNQITVAEAPTLLSEEGAIAWTLGFAKYNIDYHVVYGHEGNNDGFNCLFLFDKNKKWGMIQFNNAHEVYDFGFNLFRYINQNN
ncbi:serine hydrolase domain-containing protein [Spongiimicrobium sp. 3-5]|uniref:serine hydrolase domain-containing protein n=1 Tax=Spongiimicrobium sp. 3-5 TaxID=3332596 RepID=UPI00397F0C2F